ncbi:MAG: hypothetical protein ACOX9B_12780 [Candidatus Xenobium sp.]
MKKRRRGESKRGMQLELKAGLTPRGVVIGALSLGIAAFLIRIGWHYLEVFPVGGGLDGTLIFAGLPLGFGIALVLLTVAPLVRTCGTVIAVRRDGLRYTGRNVFFDATWGRLTYLGPTGRFKGFRSMIIGTRETRVRVDEFLFPDFDRLVTFLDRVMETGGSGNSEDY